MIEVLTITPCRIVTRKRDFHCNPFVPRTPEEESQIRMFGENVRRERMAKGVTQEKLAEMIGLNIRNVQKIEAGETNVLMTTVVRIRAALGCSSDKLIPRE